jgi:hypothetical protein
MARASSSPRSGPFVVYFGWGSGKAHPPADRTTQIRYPVEVLLFIVRHRVALPSARLLACSVRQISTRA